MAAAEDFMQPEPAQPEAGQAEWLAALSQEQNIAEMFGEDESQLGLIANQVIEEYEIDRKSMQPWLDRMKRGIDLAMLVKDDKNYPWEGAANVKYPLITTAALQFNAKAYPAIVQPDQVVRVRVMGDDPMGTKAARGDRVAEHMSWQLTNEVEEWEEDTDKLLTLLPIVGTVIRKVWHDPAAGRIRCRIILPGKFIVNDRVNTLTDSPRCSEEFDLYPGEIAERRKSGQFRDIDYKFEGEQDTQAPEMFIEQHCRLDMDEDGIQEPYIVTVHRKSRKVARIVADYDPEDIVPSPDGGVMSVRRGAYFIAYHFLPSLDGGFYGTGLGLLLGDISETINTIINQMLDAGHMASRGGGFIGSEFRIKGGAHSWKPGEWKLVGASGGDIRNAVVPMTFPGADATLFELLGLLIDAGKEVASIKDILTGETKGSSNMPATTVLALIEQGMAQFTAAFKRIFRALRQEYRLIAKINAGTVTPEAYNRFHDTMSKPQAQPQGQMGMPQGQQMPQGPQMGQPQMMPQPVMLDPRAEYDLSDMDITPVADPNSVTKMQEAAKAQIVMQMAEQQLVDRMEASKRVLEASGIPDVEELAPKPDPMQQQMAQLQMALLQAQGEAEKAKAMLAQAQAQALQFQLPAEQMKAQAAGQKAQADVAKAQSDGQIAMIKAQGEQQKLAGEQQKIAIEGQNAMLDHEVAREELAIEWERLALEAQRTNAEVRNLHAQAEAAPARAEAEIGHIKAQTKAAGQKPKPK